MWDWTWRRFDARLPWVRHAALGVPAVPLVKEQDGEVVLGPLDDGDGGGAGDRRIEVDRARFGRTRGDEHELQIPDRSAVELIDGRQTGRSDDDRASSHFRQLVLDLGRRALGVERNGHHPGTEYSEPGPNEAIVRPAHDPHPIARSESEAAQRPAARGHLGAEASVADARAADDERRMTVGMLLDDRGQVHARSSARWVRDDR